MFNLIRQHAMITRFLSPTQKCEPEWLVGSYGKFVFREIKQENQQLKTNIVNVPSFFAYIYQLFIFLSSALCSVSQLIFSLLCLFHPSRMTFTKIF